MCTGKCSRCIGTTLLPLALTSIVCNVVLFFPGWSVQYAKDGHITEEVTSLGGIFGGGLLVLMSALYIHMTGQDGCCGNRCGMFVSLLFAAAGAGGALYSFSVAASGLVNGPLCKQGGTWTTPFRDSNFSYLADSKSWSLCAEPAGVVQFNSGLFITLLATSCLQVLLLSAQLINGTIGCLCGTCMDERKL